MGDDLDEQAQFFVQKGVRTVSVTGEAEISAVPDLVTVTLGVKEQSDDLAAAQAATRAGVEQVLAAAAAFDFPAEDVQTQQLRSEKIVEVVGEDGIALPLYGGGFGGGGGFGQPPLFGGGGGDEGAAPSAKRRKHEFYRVALDVTLVVRGPRIAQYDDVMQALLGSGAEIDGECMETTRLGDLRHEARILAVANAKRKAAALTTGTGVAVGSPIVIREQGARAVAPPYFGPRGGGRTLQTARRSTGGRAPRMQLATSAARAPAFGAGGGDDDAEEEAEGETEDVTPKLFQLGSIKVTSEVSIVFELREEADAAP